MLYAGKNVQEQRRTVFQRAGFPASFIEKTSLLQQQWSPFVEYTAEGDVTASLSYVKYLLIPRIPSGSTEYILRVRGDTWSAFGGHAVEHVQSPPSSRSNTPIGLLFSLGIVTGSGFFLRKLFGSSLSWPETLAMLSFYRP